MATSKRKTAARGAAKPARKTKARPAAKPARTRVAGAAASETGIVHTDLRHDWAARNAARLLR
jgi:hypothetical protein